MQMRLDRFLAECGCGSRSDVKKLIRQGRVCVNGTPAAKPEQKTEAGTDEVKLDGRLLVWQQFRYIMLNKPAGCVTAVSDSRYPTVMSFLKEENAVPDGTEAPVCKDLAPAGRLDADTEGLLLITNDGALVHRLLSPAGHVNKTYMARVRGNVDAEDVEAFAGGLEYGEKKPALPAQLEILSAGMDEEGPVCETLMTICEGKYHQVKRMFQARGKEVIFLRRLSMGPLKLDENLRPGQWRYLTDQEIQELANAGKEE